MTLQTTIEKVSKLQLYGYYMELVSENYLGRGRECERTSGGRIEEVGVCVRFVIVGASD